MDYLKIIEIVGLITGIIYVTGAILEKKWCWYFGIIATIAYGISTFYYKLYGEFVLQFFYLAISFYGIKQWSINNSRKKIVEISHSSVKFLLINLIIGVLISYLLYLVLVYFDSSYPFWDAITSGFGIIATYLTTKKKIENWILWVLIDAILCYILYLKNMPFYSVLYFIYLFVAVLGFIQWEKMKENRKDPLNIEIY